MSRFVLVDGGADVLATISDVEGDFPWRSGTCHPTETFAVAIAAYFDLVDHRRAESGEEPSDELLWFDGQLVDPLSGSPWPEGWHGGLPRSVRLGTRRFGRGITDLRVEAGISITRSDGALTVSWR